MQQHTATTQPSPGTICIHENLTEFLVPRKIWTVLSDAWCDAWGCSEEWPGVGLLWSLWSPSNSGYPHSVIDCMIWSSCLQSATDSKYLLNYAPQVSICLSFNKQAGFVSFPFWLNLFIAKSNNKLRLFMVLELNVIGKFPRCWQEILQTTAAVLLSSFDFSITCGMFYRFHFSQDLKYCCPFPWL